MKQTTTTYNALKKLEDIVMDAYPNIQNLAITIVDNSLVVEFEDDGVHTIEMIDEVLLPLIKREIKQ